jgi:hypothetical protein
MEIVYKFGVEHYGYPQCCVVEFLAGIMTQNPITPEQIKVAESSGFIPCRDHTRQIIQGKTILRNLIAPTRQCGAFPFPNERCAKCQQEKKVKT